MKRLAKKVLLVGWDAADWKVINPLLDRGQMPALESLINRGAMGNLATLEPALSPMLWTSIATGMRPDKHGILGFIEPIPQQSGVRPVSSTSRKVKAVWNILIQAGLKAHCVGWWPSHPAEPLNGICISNHFQRARSDPGKPWPMRPGTVHPPELREFFAELRVHPGELTEAHLLPFVPKAAEVDQDNDRRLYSIAKILAENSSIHAAATWILENREWDFLGVYYDGIDHFCHGFMNFHPPQMDGVSDQQYEFYRDVVNSAYRFHDMMLARLLELAGEKTTVMLVSDHGFHSDHLRPKHIPDEPAGPAHQHRDQGILLISGPGLRQDELVHGASLLDVAPTVLSLFGLPVGADMDGKPIVQAFAAPPEIDTIPSWEATEGECGRHPMEMIEDPYSAQEALQQLVELGYIEAPGEDQEKNVRKAITESRYNLARVYMGSGRTEQALQLLEELVEEEPDQGRFAFLLARGLLEHGQAERCSALLDRFASTIGQDGAPRKEMREVSKQLADKGLDQKQRENLSKKRVKLQRKIRQAGMNVIALDMLRGDLLIKENRPREALAHYQRIEEKYPQEKNLFLRLGNAYWQLQRWRDAERAFCQSLEVDTENPDARHGLAMACLRQGRFEDAAAAALEAVGLRYYFPFAHYHLGQALEKLGKKSEAAKAYEVCLVQDARVGKARNRLIHLYEKCLHEPARAQSHRDFFMDCEKPAARGMESTDPSSPFAELTSRSEKSGDRELADPVLVVSGLPRSGTSMMMQMLAAGGFELFSDGNRAADASNPRGYFEHEAAKRLAIDKSWVGEARGKAVKVISQQLLHLPARHNYKIVFMLRDLDEVLGSQQKMLRSQGKERLGPATGKVERAYRKNLDQVAAWAKNNFNVAVLYIQYVDVITAPVEAADRVVAFLGKGGEPEAMASVVDRTLYRERSSFYENLLQHM